MAPAGPQSWGHTQRLWKWGFTHGWCCLDTLGRAPHVCLGGWSQAIHTVLQSWKTKILYIYINSGSGQEKLRFLGFHIQYLHLESLHHFANFNSLWHERETQKSHSKNKEEFQEFSLGGTPCLPPAGLFEGGKLIPGYNFLDLSILRLFQESPLIKLLLSARSELQIVGAGGYSCWFLVLLDWPLTKATQSKASPDLPAQLGCSLVPHELQTALALEKSLLS